MASPMASPDLAELLAHLDFLVAGPKMSSREDVGDEKYIQRVLVKLAERFQNQYPVAQIREQLWQEFRHGYFYPENNFFQLFLHGSSEMQSLDSRTKSLVKQQLDDINILQTCEPRRKRSLSKLAGPSELRSRNHGSVSTPTGTKSSASKTRTKVVQMNNNRKNKKARNRGVSRSQGRMKQLSTAIIPSIEIDETPSNSPFDSPAKRKLDIRTPSSATIQNGRLTPTTQSESILGNSRSCEATRSPDVTSKSTDINFDVVLAELTHYKIRCLKAEQECADLKRERRQLESLYEETQNVPEELTNALKRNIRLISTLKKKLGNMRDLEPYLSIRKVDEGVSTAQQISSCYRDLKEELSAIVGLNRPDRPSIADLYYGKTEDLSDLLSTVFGDRAQMQTEPISDLSPALTLYDLIQALTGAAIHRWIFESEYRPFSLTTTPILQKYRNHIETLCDSGSLFNLDTAVHQSIVREQSFVDVSIPSMSASSTARILDAIQPLFDEKIKYRTIKKLEATLDSVFRLAFQIRSASLVGTEEFESVWPSLGEPINESEMEMKSTKGTAGEPVVRLSLCPGLRVYSKKPSMVGYQGFRAIDGLDRTPKYVIKALVLA